MEFSQTDQEFVAEFDTGGSGGSGQDGFSPIVDVTTIDGGHRVTITDKQGAESFDVMDGETPEKGVDYWTEEDKAEIDAESKEYIAAQLADLTQIEPLFAESVEWLEENGDTSKVYVLPDGYIYGYISVNETVKNYTNYADVTSSEWLTGYRLNSSSTPREEPGCYVTNYIPCKVDDVVRVKPIVQLSSGTNIQMANASKSHLGTVNPTQDSEHCSYDAESGTFTIIAGRYTVSGTAYDRTDIAYLRFSFFVLDGYAPENVIITVNEEIKEETINTSKWANTGHAFIPANYEERIIALETKVDEMRAEIDDIDTTDTNEIILKNNVVRSVNHRGYNSVAPENTLPAYRLSKAMGFEYVECDISITRDGEFVLLHNATIDDTSSGTGTITEMTLEEVRAYDFGSWKSEKYVGTVIPTLEEFLILCRNLGLKAYLEIKNGTWTQETINECVKLVKKCGMIRNVTWIQFGGAALQYVKNADSKARLGRLSSELTADSITNTVSLKNDDNEVFVSVQNADNTIDDALITQCIENDIGLEVWDVNTENGIVALHPYVSGATTDALKAGNVLCARAMAD